MSSDNVLADDNVYTGIVKWFQPKNGYGFITVLDSDGKYTDVFAHFKSLSVKQDQYKFLVVGEYVNLNVLENTDGSKYKYYAHNISGIMKGPLMCETQLNIKNSRRDFNKLNDQHHSVHSSNNEYDNDTNFIKPNPKSRKANPERQKQ